MYTRYLTLEDAKDDTVFLWGARQTGKSTLLKTLFPDFDLDKAIINGMLPRHYQVRNAAKRLQAYIGDY